MTMSSYAAAPVRVALALAVAVCCFAWTGTATAKVVELKIHSASFDGSGSVGGPAPFEGSLYSIGVNQETGQVYVGSGSSGGRVYKFSGAGVAETFSGLATPQRSIFTPRVKIQSACILSPPPRHVAVPVGIGVV